MKTFVLFPLVLVLCWFPLTISANDTIPPPPPAVQSIIVGASIDVATVLDVQAGVDAIFMASSGGSRRARWGPVGRMDFSPSGGSVSNQAEAVGYDQPGRKYLLFLTWETTGCGASTVIDDDSPGTGNRNNTEVGYAWVGRQCWTAEIAAHELVHLLGGVQDSAPHASGWHHCTDGQDVMCYSDQPDYPSMTYPCGLEHMLLLDCGGDDYFNVSPVPGSYLASHWNVADSVFLVRMERVMLPVVGK